MGLLAATGVWTFNAIGAAAQTSAPAPATVAEDARLKVIAEAVCSADPEGDLIGDVRARLAGTRFLELREEAGRIRLAFQLAVGDEIRVSRVAPGGTFRRMTLEWWEAGDGTRLRPLVSARLDAQCRPMETRRLAYDALGRVDELIIRDPSGAETSREVLNPPVPGTVLTEGGVPGRVPVAVIDTGVNYTLPLFRGRLAARSDGRLAGYDFWDEDDRPFDLDTSAGPFVPRRHGTAVSSVLLREAPGAVILPYRYPRPDMSRFKDLVNHAHANGARIVNMALGANRRSLWQAFEEAARARPDMLFIVSAGNDGRDIDRRPVYPASLPLDNILTVTSSDDFGKLAQGSNWGREHVDVMVPGEKVPVIDHRGVAGQASGSSYAVPRVAALAARLQAKHPGWTAAELKAAILKRARKGGGFGGAGNLPLKHGWIPDPTDDFEG